MSFPYHGNYVGPGWSAGKYQSSVVDNTVPAVDKFDEAARKHDAAYFNYPDNPNRARADWDFVRDTKDLGSKAQLARSLVAIQALGRDTYSYMTGKAKKNNKKKQARKGPATIRKKGGRSLGPTRGRRSRVNTVTPNQLVSTNTNWQTSYRAQINGQRARATGREFLGTITVSSSDAIGKSLFFQNIGPQFLSGTRLQTLANQFEKYRYKKARLLLRSKCSNATDGSVVAYFERDVNEISPFPGVEGIKKAIATYGSEDIPVKNDGFAWMKKITDENPYFTDVGASADDPAYGQAIAIVQLNSTGSTVTGSTKVTHDILFEYDIDFWVPQLQTEQVLFYTFTNPNGVGTTTSALLGSAASIEEGGNLQGVTFDGATTITFNAIYSHYYEVEYIVDGATIAGCSITPQATTTTWEASTASASSTSNIVHKTIALTSSAQGTIRPVTCVLAATTITTPSFCQFMVIDYGSFNPQNPIAGPSGEGISSSRWVRGRKDRNVIKNQQQDNRLNDLEKQLNYFRKILEQKFNSNDNQETSSDEEVPYRCPTCNSVDHPANLCPCLTPLPKTKKKSSTAIQ